MSHPEKDCAVAKKLQAKKRVSGCSTSRVGLGSSKTGDKITCKVEF